MKFDNNKTDLPVQKPIKKTPKFKIDKLVHKIKTNFKQLTGNRAYSLLGITLVLSVLFLVVYFLYNQVIVDDNPIELENDQNEILQAYQNQIPQLQQKVNQNESDVAARKDLAVALYATGDLESAKNNYITAVDLKPNDYILLNNLGNVYRDLGQYEDAIESYLASIEKQSYQVSAYMNLSNVYIYSLDEFERGIETYDQAIQNMPDRADEFLLQKGNAYKNIGNTEKAREIYEETLRLDPNNTVVANLLNSL